MIHMIFSRPMCCTHAPGPAAHDYARKHIKHRYTKQVVSGGTAQTAVNSVTRIATIVAEGLYEYPVIMQYCIIAGSEVHCADGWHFPHVSTDSGHRVP